MKIITAALFALSLLVFGAYSLSAHSPEENGSESFTPPCHEATDETFTHHHEDLPEDFTHHHEYDDAFEHHHGHHNRSND